MSNFPDEYKEFEGKERYSDWVFLARQTLQSSSTGTVR
jgi:hypothetical protein